MSSSTSQLNMQEGWSQDHLQFGEGGQWRGPTANGSIYEVFCWAADESWTGEVRQQVSGFSHFQLVEVELLNRGKHLLCIIFDDIITSSFYISQPNIMWRLKIICKCQNRSISDSCHQVQQQLRRKWTGRGLTFYPAHLCSAKRYLLVVNVMGSDAMFLMHCASFISTYLT